MNALAESQAASLASMQASMALWSTMAPAKTGNDEVGSSVGSIGGITFGGVIGPAGPL